MDFPKISIVTPSYNQVAFLEQTILSVLSQRYPNLEYIVIDGGSTDGSLEIIERYSDRLAFWVSEPDDGQTHALIKGFSVASGDILAWLNSDDLYEPEALRDVAQFFIDNSTARMVYGDATWIDADGGILKPKKEHPFNRFIWTYDYNFIPQPSAFWHRDLYEEVGGLDPQFDLAMDADLWARFAEVTTLHHCRRRWSRMRLYAQQKNQRLRVRSDQEDLEIRRRYIGNEPDWSRKAKKLPAKLLRITWKLSTGCYS